MCRPALALVAAGLLAGPAAAGPIVSSPVTGTVRFGPNPLNFFDPANGFVPATGFLNSADAFNSPTVTASATRAEFGYQDLANRYTADLTDATLTITYTSVFSSLTSRFVMTFTGPGLAGLAPVLASDTFPGGPGTVTYAGTTLTYTLPTGFPTTTGQTFAAVVRLDLPPPATNVPEPATLAGLGLLTLGGWATRRVAGRRGGR